MTDNRKCSTHGWMHAHAACPDCEAKKVAHFGTGVPLEPPLAAMAQGYYAANTFCRNCGRRSWTRLKRGTRVSEAVCENCGCATLEGGI